MIIHCLRSGATRLQEMANRADWKIHSTSLQPTHQHTSNQPIHSFPIIQPLTLLSIYHNGTALNTTAPNTVSNQHTVIDSLYSRTESSGQNKTCKVVCAIWRWREGQAQGRSPPVNCTERSEAPKQLYRGKYKKGDGYDIYAKMYMMDSIVTTRSCIVAMLACSFACVLIPMTTNWPISKQSTFSSRFWMHSLATSANWIWSLISTR